MVSLPCLDSSFLPTLPSPQFRVPLGLCGFCGADVPPWAWVGFATLSLMQDRSSALSPRPSQDSPFSFSPLFSFAASWLCCIVLGLVLKRGPWTQLPKLSMIREVHLLFGKAVGGVKC